MLHRKYLQIHSCELKGSNDEENTVYSLEFYLLDTIKLAFPAPADSILLIEGVNIHTRNNSFI